MTSFDTTPAPQNRAATQQQHQATKMFFMFPPMFVAPTHSYGGKGHYNDPYASMSDKSAAALHRERQAIERFDALRSQGTPTSKMRRLLVEPSCHLTGACRSTFSKHVRSFPGWMAKRRVATLDEKEASKEKRKGKVYFVDIVYDPAKATKHQASKEAYKRAVAILLNQSAQAVSEEASEENKRAATDTTPMQPVAKRAKILQDSSNMQPQDATVSRVTP
jgi:hypothetical protein